MSISTKGIFLSQRKYTFDLLEETSMLTCQPIDTPLDGGLQLYVETNQDPVDKQR